jgi:hypothetical protein
VEKEKNQEIWSCRSRIGQFLYRKFLSACRALYRWNMPKDEELHGICPRNMPKNDKIMAFGPPNKIVLISWVDHPLQLPDQEREALEEYSIAWKAINWQLKELLGCKYHQVEEEMVRFYR